MRLPVQHVPNTLFHISTQLDWHLSKSPIAYINLQYGIKMAYIVTYKSSKVFAFQMVSNLWATGCIAPQNKQKRGYLSANFCCNISEINPPKILKDRPTLEESLLDYFVAVNSFTTYPIKMSLESNLLQHIQDDIQVKHWTFEFHFWLIGLYLPFEETALHNLWQKYLTCMVAVTTFGLSKEVWFGHGNI